MLKININTHHRAIKNMHRILEAGLITTHAHVGVNNIKLLDYKEQSRTSTYELEPHMDTALSKEVFLHMYM